MDNIRTLIVDDEPLALDLVAGYVSKVPFLSLVGRCSSAKEAFGHIVTGNVDLVFCDIQMPGMSGVSLMKSLQSCTTIPKVVFTTAFPEYALDGFRLDAIDYLLKPFDEDEFLKAANKARRIIEMEQLERNNSVNQSLSDAANNSSDENKDESNDYFFVKSEYKLVKIEKHRIQYIEGLKDYIKIYTEGEPKPILTLMSLKEMEGKLSETQFVRVHRSFIVNMAFVNGVERGQLLLNNGVHVPMGDKYKSQINELINGKVI